MAIALYFDVNIPDAIAVQLRRRGVEVLTVVEDGRRRLPDDLLLEHARELGRVVFTFDVGFRLMAEQWQRDGRQFAGLIFGRELGATVGQFVSDLELVALASEPEEFANLVLYLPLT
jgi:hypothetical protein